MNHDIKLRTELKQALAEAIFRLGHPDMSVESILAALDKDIAEAVGWSRRPDEDRTLPEGLL
jgi:hypothetical protein